MRNLEKGFLVAFHRDYLGGVEPGHIFISDDEDEDDDDQDDGTDGSDNDEDDYVVCPFRPKNDPSPSPILPAAQKTQEASNHKSASSNSAHKSDLKADQSTNIIEQVVSRIKQLFKRK